MKISKEIIVVFSLFWLFALLCTADKKRPDGISLYDEGRYLEAVAALAQDLQNPSQERFKARNYAYMAKCYQQLDNPSTAKRMWEILCRDYPNNLYAAQGHYFLAGQAKIQGKEDKWKDDLAKAAVFFKRSIYGGKAARDLGDYHYWKDERIRAWKWYSQAIRSSFSSEEKIELGERLNPMVVELLLYQKVPSARTYRVRKGDYLAKIARKFNTTQGMILWVNHKHRSVLRVGEKLKIIANSLWVEVQSENSFIGLFFKNGRCIRSFKADISKQIATGNYVVGSKIKNPDWYDGDRRVPYGDPKNFLGTRWIGFRNEKFGIHGGEISEKIAPEADGFVCMDDEDVEFLFDMIDIGTKVIVK